MSDDLHKEITPITFKDVKKASSKIYTEGITETNLQVSCLVLTYPQALTSVTLEQSCNYECTCMVNYRYSYYRYSYYIIGPTIVNSLAI